MHLAFLQQQHIVGEAYHGLEFSPAIVKRNLSCGLLPNVSMCCCDAKNFSVMQVSVAMPAGSWPSIIPSAYDSWRAWKVGSWLMNGTVRSQEPCLD